MTACRNGKRKSGDRIMSSVFGELNLFNVRGISLREFRSRLFQPFVGITLAGRNNRFPKQDIVAFDPLVIEPDQFLDELRIGVQHRVDDAFQLRQSSQFRRGQPPVSIHDVEVTGQGEQRAAFALLAHLRSHLLDLWVVRIDCSVERIVLGRRMNFGNRNSADILPAATMTKFTEAESADCA